MADSLVSRFGCYTIIWDTTVPISGGGFSASERLDSTY